MIYVTTLASSKINGLLSGKEKVIGIRIGVKTTGCSGLAYVLEYVYTENLVDDNKYDIDNIMIYINKKHLVYVDGLTINWEKKGLNEGFEFINPNEVDRCGCGESFRV